MSIYIPNPTLYLRTDKKKKNGKMPLYIRFQRIDGKEPKFSLGKKGKTFEFSEDEWDNNKRLPFDSDLEIIVNNEFYRIKSDIKDAVRQKKEITIDLLRKIVENENVDTSGNASFYNYFNKYLAVQEKKGKMSNSTFKLYMTTYRSLKEFREVISIKDINEKLINDFKKFLIKRGNETGRGDVEGSQYNRLRHIRAVINYIETKQKIKIENPFRSGDVTINEYPTNDIFLERRELEKLNKYFLKKLSNGTIKYDAMAMFLFASLTGLRLGDILSLKWKHIDRSKEPWIIRKTLKKVVNGRKIKIENIISKYALCLLDWTQDDYNNMERPERLVFPEIRPKKLNDTLRECAEKVGIEKHLTFHSSRRTCATHFMVNGMDRIALMKFMGHVNFNTTLKYTKWSGEISEEYADKIEIVEAKKPLIK